ncbi:glycoside hydrolase family 30 beta sandwich domain-containing protein [Capnocytophaga sp.]|uniref:glycoside hydrolase family 30 protein n=1 Tax=Capnocytophaga sp. TaxID=44737 RepID=UPI0026DC2CD4|nr:glycoside hydrolase family 30 beta sandwich domain-containing protein [Capnocytophaga sp.]MDO5105887.1 glycoside hydrolase family 30 beta sandwich domain-containing protein [Capnocytophaga sp.]
MTRISLSYLSCLVGLFAACNNPKGNPTDPSDTASERVSVWVSSGDRTKSFHFEELEFLNETPEKGACVRLNPSEKFQSVYGFGSAITGSTCFNLFQMEENDRNAFLTETFSPEKMAQSYIRVPIGCSDFSLSEYTCCDKEGIEHFALAQEDTQYIIPILKEIIRINPSVKIIGSPWTAPRWMKVNNLKELKPHNEWTSGHLNPKYYDDYARYFVKWIEAMQANGIPIEAITIQNEPLNRGNSASMFMGWQEQLAFVKQSLGKTLQQAGLNTKVYLFDHNYNYDNMPEQKHYPLHIYADKEASQYITGSAYHNYGGQFSELEYVHNQAPDKELIFTETSIGKWNDGRNLSHRLADDMEQIGIGTLNNWCKAVIVWNLLLDENGGPYRELGCKTCFGAVDIASDYKTLTHNSHYYVIGHLAKVIKPNAVRIAHQLTDVEGILCTSFLNDDGSYALVLLNKATENKIVTITDGTKTFRCEVPANAVASFRWK